MVAPVPDFINGEVNSEAAIDKNRSWGREESETGHKRQEEKTMANLSDAFGTIIVRAEKMITLEKLIEFLEYSNDEGFGEYGMDLEGFRYVRNEYSPALKADFTGRGRWLFSATLECLLDDIKIHLSPDHELVKALETEYFSMEVNYIDSEESDSILCKEEDIIVHEAGTSLEKSEFIVRYTEGFDWTWANQIALGTDILENLIRKDYRYMVTNNPVEWEQDEVESFIKKVDSELPELLNVFNYSTERDFFQQHLWVEGLYLMAQEILTNKYHS